MALTGTPEKKIFLSLKSSSVLGDVRANATSTHHTSVILSPISIFHIAVEDPAHVNVPFSPTGIVAF